MTGDEVRALCLDLPETTEKETWGDVVRALRLALPETTEMVRTAPKKLAAVWRGSR